MADIRFPEGVKRGMGYWLNPTNIWASRRKFLRRDNSNTWRKVYLGTSLRDHPDRSMPFSELLDRDVTGEELTLLVLGDTGEGDWSQYSLLPLIRALEPDLMLLNGDVAYPAGRVEDYRRGFFEPYRGLGIPIWAVPGNHEYYSRLKGREFVDVFCTYRRSREWSEAGLPLVPQPGTYWEIREPGGEPGVVILGIDTGMAGDLDGHGRNHEPDAAQLDWLRSRLERAEAEGRPVVVLFHIPALVNEADKEKVHLHRLHEILATSPQVRLILTGHVHNHQHYTPETFRRYLEESQNVDPPALENTPHFIVSGLGGAFLARPEHQGTYPAETVYPSREQWQEHARMAEKLTENLGLARAAVGRIAGGISSSGRNQAADVDAARHLGLVMLKVGPRGTTVRQVLLDALPDLFDLPDSQIVRVDDPEPPVDPGKLKTVVEKYPAIEL